MRSLLAVAAALAVLASHVSAQQQTRGIPKSMEPTYAGVGGKFTCLDKSATINLNQVNDEYCDCADGSDEPGTSACANSRFYCTNKGYRGKYIASLYVNDGVCDCCDGSDEWASRAKCANTCDVDGAAWRASQAAAIAAAEEGARARLAYAAAGQEAAKARQGKIAEAQGKVESARAAREKAEAAVASAEDIEKRQTEERRASMSKSGGSAIAVGLGLQGMDRDAALLLLGEWIRSSGQAALLEAWLGDKAKEGRLPGTSSDGSFTPKLVDPSNPEGAVPDVKTPEGEAARAALATARSEETRAGSELSTLQEEDRTDYGPDKAFYQLKERCLDYQEAQYRYSVCLFGRATQDGTHLGTFSGWKAEGSNPYATMLFTGGQSCWNGPQRSIAVSFKCGSKDEVLKVEEPEKCTYSAIMTTPAVCDDRAARELRLSLEEPETSTGNKGEL